MTKSEELQKRIDDSLTALKTRAENDSYPYAVSGLRLVAEVLASSSQLAEISSGRLERQTNKLICLTWALVGLTAALLLSTIAFAIRH
jgi:hypothetical protein